MLSPGDHDVMPPRVHWFVLIACGILLQAEPGLGQARAPVGTLDATGYGEITRGAPVRISKPDASETSEQIARLFQSQLSVCGFGIASTGMANVLSFRFTSDVSADPKAFPMVELSPRERKSELRRRGDIGVASRPARG